MPAEAYVSCNRPQKCGSHTHTQTAPPPPPPSLHLRTHSSSYVRCNPVHLPKSFISAIFAAKFFLKPKSSVHFRVTVNTRTVTSVVNVKKMRKRFGDWIYTSPITQQARFRFCIQSERNLLRHSCWGVLALLS